MPKTKTHGGKRPGAGRPRIGNESTVKHSVTLPQEWWEYAQSEHVGDGSLSAGVLAALTYHAQAHGKKRKTG